MTAIKTILIVLCCAFLIGCRDEIANDNASSDQHTDSRGASENVTIPADIPYFDLYGNYEYALAKEKYFPAFKYRSFPRNLRQLMQRSDIEDSECRDSAHGAAGLQACNRRERLGSQIERLGWCWNSLEHTGSFNHWMRCRDDPAYEPRRANDAEHPYTQQELRGSETDYQAYLRENPNVAAYRANPTPQEEAAMRRNAVRRNIDIFGRYEPRADDLRDVPLSRFLAFPRKLRPLMQQAEIDEYHCGPSFFDSMQACNRSRHTMAKLEELGWCWGSRDHISANATHWMKCSQMPDRDPNDPKPDSLLFDEMDVLRSERRARLPNPYRD